MNESHIGESLGSKKDGWGQSGTLTVGGSKTVGMQVQFPRADTYTLQFNITPPANGNPVNAEARISWSVEGQTVTRRVSIANGLSVSGTGQAVNVQMTDATPGNFPTAPSDYNVSCQVTRGVRGSSGQPPTFYPIQPFNTLVTFVVAGATAAAVPLPSDAGITQIFVTCASATAIPPATIFLQLTNNVPLPVKIWDPILTEGWIPVPPGTTVFNIDNHNAFAIDVSISFGIDG